MLKGPRPDLCERWRRRTHDGEPASPVFQADLQTEVRLNAAFSSERPDENQCRLAQEKLLRSSLSPFHSYSRILFSSPAITIARNGSVALRSALSIQA